MKINEFIETKTPVQQAIEEHVARGVPFRECIFRPGSTAFREFYRTVRDLHSQGLVECDWEDVELLETDIGEYIRINGEVVPLDVPFISEKIEVDDEGAIATIDILKNFDWNKVARMANDYGIAFDIQDDNKRPGQAGSYYLLADFADEIEEFAEVLYSYDNSLFNIDQLDEAEYNGKKVELNKPKRGGPKKFYVYVKNPKTGRVKKVTWGDTTGLKTKTGNKGAVKSFVARHKCKQKNDKTKAGYWACRTPRYKSLGVKGGQWW